VTDKDTGDVFRQTLRPALVLQCCQLATVASVCRM